LLVYDADCAFCVFWARYWQKLTADAVHYRPYQEAAAHTLRFRWRTFSVPCNTFHPRTPRECRGGKLPDLEPRARPGILACLYRKLPGFAAISELIYAFIAAHRAAFYRISLFLWGRDYGPPRYDLVSFLFLRLFGLIYLAAFTSFGVQALGLIGSHGILPLAELVEAVGGRAGAERFFVMPMLFWISAGRFCDSGGVLGRRGFLAAPDLQRVAALKLVSAVRVVSLAAVWRTDIHVLPMGHVSAGGRIPWPADEFARVPGIWLLRWLLFRFMFMSALSSC